MKRRDFLSGVAVTSASLIAGPAARAEQTSPQTRPAATGGRPRNIMISAANGITSRGNHLQAGYEKLTGGADTLEAAITTVTEVENDPKDTSVGLGGLPNEEGVVELDSCCMHGPTRRAGSVGAVRDIKNVAALGRAVFEHTGHVMLVGEGATRFAVAMGFPKENLLTDESRKIWLLWKEYHSDQDWWGPGLSDPNWTPPKAEPETGELQYPVSPDQGSRLARVGQAGMADRAAFTGGGGYPDWEQPLEAQPRRIQRLYAAAADLGIPPEDRMDAIYKVLYPPHGTINCSALNEKGEMSSVTTTSGLAWKLPGRCGDSPIIGAGCYCDQDVGAAGATGSGEENIKVCGAHSIVENMRRGMSPEEAGMEVLKRIARNFNNDMTRLRFVSMHYYILRKDGAYGGVSMWSGPKERPYKFAVADGNGAAHHETAKALYQGVPLNWPPEPRPPGRP